MMHDKSTLVTIRRLDGIVLRAVIQGAAPDFLLTPYVMRQEQVIEIAGPADTGRRTGADAP